MNIADLHCDLLSYLAADDTRTVHDSDPRCSLPQLKKGNVCLQTMAVYTATGPQSVALAEKQFAIFRALPTLYPNDFSRLNTLKLPEANGKVHIVAAIENASGLCDESEPLDNCFTRFDQYLNTSGPIAYISLTWNFENRFGGGNLSHVGLKPDGERLLEYLSGKRVAIDLSHTSDALAYDILNTIDKKRLKLLPIASHSNFRSIVDVPRNLPDSIAKEIIRRRGVIGLNFFKPFVGKYFPDDFARQVDYACSFGACDQYCFGADFFYDKDLPVSSYPPPAYYEPFSNAGCYPEFLSYLNAMLTREEIEKVAFKNIARLFEEINRLCV